MVVSTPAPKLSVNWKVLVPAMMISYSIITDLKYFNFYIKYILTYVKWNTAKMILKPELTNQLGNIKKYFNTVNDYITVTKIKQKK